jgi:SAM-dependent methyltransferase
MLEPIPCAICDETRTHLLYTKFDLPIGRCVGCGLVSANPRLPAAEIWKRYSSRYFHDEYLPALGVVDGRFNLEDFDRRYASLLAVLAARHPTRGHVLEIGCGAGFFLASASRAGWTARGLELSADGVEFARTRLNLDVLCEPAETMSLPDGSMDAVVLIEVIEHLLDPLSVLKAARRVLRPGGTILLTTPNFNAISRWGLGVGWSILSPGEHVYYFTASTLARLLTRAGFVDPQAIQLPTPVSLLETMNAAWTHAPDSRRARLFRGLVQWVGPLARRAVQAAGRGDTLRIIAVRA